MAIPGFAPAYDYAVRAGQKGPEYINLIDSPAAHHAYRAYIGGILNTHGAGKVGRRSRTPVAEKGNNHRFKILFDHLGPP